jgi:hypothetical protein
MSTDWNESVIQKDWNVTCLGLSIFAIMELTITTLFRLDIKCAASDVLTRTLLLLQQTK